MDNSGSVLFIGLGRMGFSMASRLLSGGASVKAWDIDAASRDRWLAAGGTLCDAVALDAPQAQTLLLCLSTPHDVEALLDRWEQDGGFRARYVVDLGTASPSISQALSARFAGLGAQYMDAPVTGGTGGAASGHLCVMVGSSADAYSSVLPLLERLGTLVVHAGDVGSGSRLKSIVQYIYLSYNVAFAMGASLGARAGLDPDSLWPVLRHGACAHPLINERLDAMAADGTHPGFPVWRALKDLSYLEDREPSCDAVQWLHLMEEALRAAQTDNRPQTDLVRAITRR